jgi:sodium-independent sulfate anion transporter 11
MKTPFINIITIIIILLTIYILIGIFFYISIVTLSGVIIYTVDNLIIYSKILYQFWWISSINIIIFFAGVSVTVFSSIKNGIFTAIDIFIAILLFRIIKIRECFLNKIKINFIIGDYPGNYRKKSDTSNFNDNRLDIYNMERELSGNIFLSIKYENDFNLFVKYKYSIWKFSSIDFPKTLIILTLIII